MGRFKVDVYLTNGGVDHLTGVDMLETKEGSLHVYAESSTVYGGPRRHLGSYPLTSVLKWKILDP